MFNHFDLGKKGVGILVMPILLILFLNLASAAPPTFSQTFTEGYTIQIPQDNTLQAGKAYDFDFHVYNISNGKPIFYGIGCYLHIYGITGEHIFSGYQNNASATYDYEFEVPKTNFTTPGEYYYNIQCNGTNLGGYSSANIEVTPSGNMNMLGFYFIALILSLGVMAFGISKGDISLTLLGCFGLYSFGVWTLINGIDIYRNNLTEGLSIVTLGIAGYVSIRSAWEYFK